MIFEIRFNQPDVNDTEEFYDFIGAKLEEEFPELPYYTIELNSFEELEALIKKINQKYYGNDYHYTSVLGFDDPYIYLDCKI